LEHAKEKELAISIFDSFSKNWAGFLHFIIQHQEQLDYLETCANTMEIPQNPLSDEIFLIAVVLV
jgi:hypothetical protein